jgi:hypothetical protein
MEKSSPKCWLGISLSFSTLLKVNNHPLRENSPNLVTLVPEQVGLHWPCRFFWGGLTLLKIG